MKFQPKHKSLALGLFAIASLASPSASPAEPVGAKPQPHHVSVDSAVYPWSSLAKIFNSVGGSCTGAVIAPNRVLTAAHCLYAFRTHRFLPAEALHILIGYTRGDYRIHARVTRYHMGQGYDPAMERQTAASDWAVLELADMLPADVRPLAITPLGQLRDRKIMVAGFARDRAYVLTADDDCHVTAQIGHGGLLAHDCMIEPGDSGAPLLRQPHPKDEASIIGVTIGIWQIGADKVGIAAPLPPDLLPGSGI